MNRTAIILAGGASQRMGVDKAFINFNGMHLIEWVISAVKPSVGDIYVAVSDNRKGFYRDNLSRVKVIEDIYPEKSPIVGLISALKEIKTGYTFVTACDMPLINTKVVDYLFEQSKNRDGSVVFKPDGWIEPFLSVYHVSNSLVEAERLYRSQDLRIRMVARNLLNMKKISTEKIRKLDPELLSLTDVDTLEMLRKAQCLT
jgi:molybdopterin-guanine dinucleotide biosynthesis protein A